MHDTLTQVLSLPSAQKILEPCLTTSWQPSPTKLYSIQERSFFFLIFLAFTSDIVPIFNCSLIASCINLFLAMFNLETYEGVQCSSHAYNFKDLKINYNSNVS